MRLLVTGGRTGYLGRHVVAVADGRDRDVGRAGARDLGVRLHVGGVDDGVGTVPPEQRVDRGRVAYVGVRRSDRDHLVSGCGRHDVPAQVAGAATRDEEPHQKTR